MGQFGGMATVCLFVIAAIAHLTFKGLADTDPTRKKLNKKVAMKHIWISSVFPPCLASGHLWLGK